MGEVLKPVSWRYRFVTTVDGKDWSDWFIVDDRESIPYRDPARQVIEPLYAAPPRLQAGDVGGMRTALEVVRMSFGWQTLADETKALIDAALSGALTPSIAGEDK